MKKIGIFLIVVGSILLISLFTFAVIGSYQLKKEITSYWYLANKYSTAAKKLEYIDLFVQKLENSNLKGKYDAIILKTPDNSFDLNLEALKSLQIRLHEIKNMNVSSFEYQTAMHQITEQEREATSMISELKGVWLKENYPLLWGWIAFIQVLSYLGFVIIGLIILNYDEDYLLRPVK